MGNPQYDWRFGKAAEMIFYLSGLCALHNLIGLVLFVVYLFVLTTIPIQPLLGLAAVWLIYLAISAYGLLNAAGSDFRADEDKEGNESKPTRPLLRRSFPGNFLHALMDTLWAVISLFTFGALVYKLIGERLPSVAAVICLVAILVTVTCAVSRWISLMALEGGTLQPTADTPS